MCFYVFNLKYNNVIKNKDFNCYFWGKERKWNKMLFGEKLIIYMFILCIMVNK